MAYTYGTVTKCKVGNGTTRNEYECRLGYQVNSQSIADNTSNVTLRLEVRSISSSYGTYGYNQTTTIDGTSLSAKSFDMRSTNTWQLFGSRTITVKHNTDGSYSASKSGSFTTTASGTYSLKSGSASVTVAPAKIPRYGTSNQSLNSKTETTIKMNWSSDNTVDYIWYSTNNGSSWVGVDVTDGTSGTYNITGLTPNTAYNIKTRIRRKDSQLTTDSTALAVTTYKAPTNSLNSATETTIKVNWSIDSTADYIWYSKDNGKTWVDVGGVSTTSGSYTITGLGANTSYNIKTRVRRKATQSIYDASTLNATTYDYPYCTSTPNFIIGNALTLSFYNPLNRTFNFTLVANGLEIYTWSNITGTSYTGVNGEGAVNNLYKSIPKASSGIYKVIVTYGSSTKTRDNGNTYSIKGTEKPVFTNFTYKDTNSTVSNVLGSDQYLVKNLSNLQVSISSANKMVGSNSATPKNYIATIDTLNKNANYSTSDLTLNLGTPISAGTKRLMVTAYDYRNLYTSIYKDVIIFEHNKPVVNVDIKRLNNFEAETTLKVSGTYSRIIINGTDKNSIIGATYRYREVGGEWSSETNFNCTINSGEFTCNDVVLSLDNSKEFEFEISIKDKLQTVNRDTYPVGVGQAVFFISSNKKQCYINGKLVKGSLEISAEEPRNGEELWIQKGKNLAKVITNSMTDGGVTFTPVSKSELKIAGTTTANIYACIIPSLFLKANRKYTMSVNYDTSGSVFIYTNKYGNVGLSYSNFYLASGRKISFTPTQDGEIDLILYVNKGISINHNLQIQIEENSTPTDYEPYVETTINIKDNSGNYDKIFTGKDGYIVSNLPVHSGGTNGYTFKKVNDIVVLNVDNIWVNSITANTWIEIGTIPEEIRPKINIQAPVVASIGSTGNVISYGKMGITTDGVIKCKMTSAISSLSSFTFNIIWVI